ncbi:ParB N-terminal domain-containing protein [Nocardioides sp. J2M5]|uniref:ParB N-terminal domain-containing protein n=1 Tax=Nocardioides palaemonis TaxID=2829810 RepID=UPI001BA73CB6|nr:ParB N-terminal domain-containing protein [Nocardioides palaemonis]MBS2938510.1 ParB N-terminal domain-containing protein [Nocardioides palaemonis]
MPDTTTTSRPHSTGHVELERTLDSIVVGVRHRKDLGDIDALAQSIQEVGLLQPITITPAGVLVCGLRRLEAQRRLGRSTTRVYVRSGISDELSHLLAQQDENQQRKPLTQLEAAHMYNEVKRLMAEEAAGRQAASRFGNPTREGGPAGAEGPTAPRGTGDARAQASRLITGTQSFARLEQINKLEQVERDSSKPASVRELAATMLEQIEAGSPVEPAYKRVMAALELASAPAPSNGLAAGSGPRNDSDDGSDELGRLAAEALARVRQSDARKGLRGLKTKTVSPHHRSLRSFILTWTELEGWSDLYDVDALARSLTTDEWERFERVAAETSSFADRLRAARLATASA